MTFLRTPSDDLFVFEFSGDYFNEMSNEDLKLRNPSM